MRVLLLAAVIALSTLSTVSSSNLKDCVPVKRRQMSRDECSSDCDNDATCNGLVVVNGKELSTYCNKKNLQPHGCYNLETYYIFVIGSTSTANGNMDDT